MKLPLPPIKSPINGMLPVPWVSFFSQLVNYINNTPTKTDLEVVAQVASDDLKQLKEASLIYDVAAQTAAISGEINTAVDEIRTTLEEELAIARAEIEAGYTAADAVIDADVTTLSATVGDVQADLATELITRADADSALSASITTLNSNLGTTNANLTSESITRAAADSALTGSFTTLSSTVGTVQSDLSTELVTRANADSALSASITSLNSSLGTTNSNLSAEAITRANADSALSATVSTLSTTVGGHTTSISSLTSSTNGLNALYGVTINNNGHVSGFALNSTAESNGGLPTSAFVIQADKFVLIDPGTAYTDGNSPDADNIPFAVVGGVTYIKSANIQDLTIGGSKLENNSTYNTWNYNDAINVNIPTTLGLVATSTQPTNTFGDGEMVINSYVFIEDVATNASRNLVQCYVTIYVNGVAAATSTADAVFLPDFSTLRNTYIHVFKLVSELSVSVFDNIEIKIYAVSDAANKVRVGNFYNVYTLYKK